MGTATAERQTEVVRAASAESKATVPTVTSEPTEARAWDAKAQID